jgi:hypothetical protein
VIASLLPGLRDLRTPLAAGYLWLVGLWLILYDEVPKSLDEASGPIAALFELGTLVGSTVLLAAVSFVAFLLGSLLMFTVPNSRIYIRQGLASRSTATRLVRRLVRINEGYELFAQLRTFINPRLREASEFLPPDVLAKEVPQGRIGPLRELEAADYESDDVIERQLAPRYATEIVYELDAVGIQLQAKNRDFWDTYDRQAAEAQFRFSITSPLVLIILIIALESDQYWWLLLLFVPVLLFVQSADHAMAANATLVQAIVLRMVKPPVCWNESTRRSLE